MKAIVLLCALWIGVGSCLTGCSGQLDPCSWLPGPNQEQVVLAFQEARFEGYGRDEVLVTALSLNGLPSIFDPEPAEFSYCMEDLVDRAFTSHQSREASGAWTTTFPRWDADGTFMCCVLDCSAPEPDSPPCPCTYGIGECTCLLMSEGYGYWEYSACLDGTRDGNQPEAY